MNLRLRLLKLQEILPNLHRGAAPLDAPLMLSLHIPKTAGTSFRSFLREAYGRRLQHDYGIHSVMTTGIIRAALRLGGEKRIARLSQDVARGRVGCIHGHFSANSYIDDFPEADWVCWLREPVGRVISLYNHHRRTFNPRNPGGMAVHEGRLTLMEFAGMNHNRDSQTRRLARLGPERFAFIGLVERYDSDIERFIRRFNLPIPVVPQPVRNRSPQAEPVDPETRERIADLNREDLALYQEVLRRNQ